MAAVTRREDGVLVYEGTVANETIDGSDGRDLIYATGSRAAIGQATAPGGHLVRAGAGDDTIIPGQGSDTVQGSSGNDLIHGYGGDGVSPGHTIGNWVSDGSDALAGDAGDDTIFGYGGNDRMEGGPGADLLKGGPGADILTGGPGVDTFQFGFLAPGVYLGWTPDSGVGWGIRDTITDFRPGVDRIDLKGYGGITDLTIEPLGDGLLLRFDAHGAGRAVTQEIEIGLAPAAVFRFFHKVQGTHFYTASAAERDSVIANYAATYTYEGTSFFAAEAEAGAPVFRFFHKQLGTHFYTASAAEREFVAANYAETYSFEGAAFFAADGAREGWDPVYRFFHKEQGSHFYTASSAERDQVNATLGHLYQDEGIAYYVPARGAADIIIDV